MHNSRDAAGGAMGKGSSGGSFATDCKIPQALAAQRGYRSFCVPNNFLPSTASALGKDYEKEV